MGNATNTTENSHDLFGNAPPPRSRSTIKRKLPPEWVAARVLCRQLRRKKTPREKKRIVHLICLNLLSMLKRGS